MVVDRKPVTFGSLPGITYWQRRLEEECARAARHGREFIAVLIELSSDGTLNGQPLPPAEGTMAVAADTLRRCLRTADVVCGLTPVRFGVLLVETNLERSRPVVARLLRLVQRDVVRRLPQAEPPILRVGFATYGADCATLQDLMLAIEQDLDTNALLSS
ncbi:MAG: hypothetical protein ACYDCQ_21180 [Dehalococcoidia bacterium]